MATWKARHSVRLLGLSLQQRGALAVRVTGADPRRWTCKPYIDAESDRKRSNVGAWLLGRLSGAVDGRHAHHECRTEQMQRTGSNKRKF